ncbi:MAG: phosphatidate cytidylyltransferase [Oscillospiraceae bacterium]
MLKRIISALVGILIGIAFLIIDNIWVYAVVVSFFGTVGTWELIGAVKCREFKLLTASCLVYAAGVPFLALFGLTQLWLPVFASFMFLLCAIMLTKHRRIKFEHIAMCGSGALLISLSLSCVILFRYTADASDRALGVYFFLYLLFCAWFGDSGAYFVGTFLGKHPLCPNISPKKTVEGFLGGIVTVGAVVFITTLIFNNFVFSEPRINYLVVIVVGMIASVFGVFGDLSASVIKREYGVKDFGNIMPGHGGVLDRFDSVIFVAPFVYIIFKYLSPTFA